MGRQTDTIILAVWILILASISQWYLVSRLIIPNADARIEYQNGIFANEQVPPYQYRVLLPSLALTIQNLLANAFPSISMKSAHVLSYAGLEFGMFLAIFALFHRYLVHWFSGVLPFVGLACLQTVIPLAITGQYMEDDFATLLFYLIGFVAFLKRRDWLLPILITIGTFNREQIIYLLIFYVVYRVFGVRSFGAKQVTIVVMSILGFAAVFVGLRFFYGFKPSQYTIALHLSHNLNLYNLLHFILPVWGSEVLGFVLLCILAFRRSAPFFQWSVVALIPYTVVFVISGNLWELGKYLPAFITLIPMSLQALGDAWPRESPAMLRDS